MGFYLRKSISVGPIRFNLSKSGVGLSAGIKGFRIGTGPRGNYVHMGRGGLYYRATLPSERSGATSSDARRNHPLQQLRIPDGTHATLEEIESVEANQIVDSSSRELLEELSRKRKTIRIWPIVLVAALGTMLLGLHYSWPSWLMIASLVAFMATIYAAYLRDVMSKTVVVFYQLDAELEKLYEQLHAAMSAISSASAVWHIEASGKVHDRKYHAGASHLLRRKSTSVRRTEPPYVKTNVETVAIGVGRQTLHFFPDRVLVYEPSGVGAVGYQELLVEAGQTQFIEEGSVPRDAKVVGRTWKYLNKSGKPDKRFKDNREIPVCLYEEIALSSTTGLKELLHVSVCGTGSPLKSSIAALAQKLKEIGNREAV